MDKDPKTRMEKKQKARDKKQGPYSTKHVRIQTELRERKADNGTVKSIITYTAVPTGRLTG